MESEERHPTLLIVDDESRILTALRRALRREGYEILTTQSPEEALVWLSQRRIDLVLSDEKMPGIGGMELLAKAARIQPGASLLLITGWTEAVPPEDLSALGVRAVISKPWDDTDLKRTLRDALAA